MSIDLKTIKDEFPKTKKLIDIEVANAKKTYKKYAEGRAKNSPILKNCFCAFLVGGTICTIAEILHSVYADALLMEEENALTLVSVTLVAVAALLTGIGVFDKIAKFAGAGTLVPITGFANSVCSCAIDGKPEGFIRGVGAGMFAIAGPVIVYGISAGVIYGIIYYTVTVIF